MNSTGLEDTAREHIGNSSRNYGDRNRDNKRENILEKSVERSREMTSLEKKKQQKLAEIERFRRERDQL